MIENALVLIGCGNLGKSLLTRWQKNDILKRNIIVVTPHPEKVKEQFDVTFLDKIEKIDDAKNCTFVFCIKPNMLIGELPLYKKFGGKNNLFISTVGGKKIDVFLKNIGSNERVIRTMPNISALIGKGITLITGKNITENDRKHADKLFEALGKNFWFDDESLFDEITVFSGCGPAYFYHFCETLIDAAGELGIPRALASEIIQETFIGSAELASFSNKSMHELIDEVATPGGITITAINSFKGPENNLKQSVCAATKIALERAKEISK